MQYLLDTSICVFLLRQRYGVGEKVLQAGVSNCFISELTYAELLYGAEYSDYPEKNKALVNRLLSRIRVVPIKDAIPLFAKEKARLRKAGTLVEDFDLLIGATAVQGGFTMVTGNIRHFQHIEGIQLENWVVR
jgi:tRNA(fMet)-specific endonuclease VapC